MPHYYIFNQWVKIPSTQDGENTTKCLHCGKEIMKNSNEREVYDGCPGEPVLCSIDCFESLHTSGDGFELVPQLKGWHGPLVIALFRRELGRISRGEFRQLLTIENSVVDHRMIESVSDVNNNEYL